LALPTGIDPIRRTLAIQLQYVPAGVRQQQARFLQNRRPGIATAPDRHPPTGRGRCDLPRSTPVRRARKSAPGPSWYLRTGFPEAFGPAAANRKRLQAQLRVIPKCRQYLLICRTLKKQADDEETLDRSRNPEDERQGLHE
jgi:hypothetical protein